MTVANSERALQEDTWFPIPFPYQKNLPLAGWDYLIEGDSENDTTNPDLLGSVWFLYSVQPSSLTI